MRLQAGNWGELVPADVPPTKGVRILLLASDVPLFSCLSAVHRINRALGESVTVAAVCSDAITDPAARISARKRMWKDYTAEEQAQSYERARAYCMGHRISFYSGSIKMPPFPDLLRTWKPDIVLSAFFGQLIPGEVISTPRFGIYNLHPSDTARGIRGVDPFTDTISAGIRQENGEFGEVVIHEVTERFDEGHVVISTPGLAFHDHDGVIPSNPVHIGFKFSLFIYPVLVYTLIKKIIETKRPCHDAEVFLSEALLARMQEHRYPAKIGFTWAEDLLRKMDDALELNFKNA